ncbi:hypothetical protein H9P43_005069 [Blastocladiella emersonii ATCC 22665]|nr:hypothetical protein H9P43_005069 [Blastocladiella emersonii ATCC 22665]
MSAETTATTTTTTASEPAAAAPATVESTATAAPAATATTAESAVATSAPAPAAVVEIPTETAEAATASSADATAAAATTEATREMATETTAKKIVEEDEHVKSKCCCCIEIRAGVVFLLGISLLLNIISLFTSIGGRNSSAVVTTIYVFDVVVGAWGLWAAMTRNADQFSMFAIFNLLLLGLGVLLLFFVTGPFIVFFFVFIAWPAYVAWVYLQYAKRLKVKEAKHVAEKAVGA